MNVLRMLIFTLAVVLGGAAPEAYAAEAEAWPSALENAGYSRDAYTVLMGWQETSRAGDLQIVSGYRIQPGAGDAFDVYFDDAGSQLDALELSQMGIHAKDWSASGSAKMERAVAKRALRSKAPTPKSVTAALAPTAIVALPEVDLGAVFLEDEQDRLDGGKGGHRIGVFQELDAPVVIEGGVPSVGEWVSGPNGDLVWSIVLNAPGAIGMRVHFATFELPLGAYVVVYDAFETSEVYGPLTEPAKGLLDLWSPTCFSDTIVVECVVPADDVEKLSLVIDKTTYQYVGLDELVPKVGTCHNDVTCFPAWADAAKGVCGIASIGDNGALACTASLLADQDSSTQIPYLLSANHCGFSSQSGAASLEAYWFYQTASCNGVAPNPATVPRTSGEAFLAASGVSSGTDFALFRLDASELPDGVTFLAWSSVGKPVGTPTACIHHPDGSFKRLTFGDITNDTTQSLRDGVGDDRPIERFHQSTWSDGVTEPGSSGSPLFDATTQEVIGQLWGGPSFCGATGNALMDYYGRFDVTYPLVESFLGGGAFEGPEDIDGDNDVDAVDVQLVINDALNISTGLDSDVNDDGAVDAVDVQLVINAALGL